MIAVFFRKRGLFIGLAIRAFWDALPADFLKVSKAMGFGGE
jgi:hypothetical protein